MPLVNLRKPGLPPDMGGVGADPSNQGEFFPQGGVGGNGSMKDQLNGDKDQSRETPRERVPGPGPMRPDMMRTSPREESIGAQQTPVRPRTPSPSSMGPAQPPMLAGVLPAPPPPSMSPMADIGPMVRRRGTMFGEMGGLKGGGLGVPSNPVNLAENDPISTLMQLLGKKGL